MNKKLEIRNKKLTFSQVPFLFMIRAYQVLISPFLGHHCRFQPTCSQYALMAIEKHGAAKGLFLTIKRLLRCQPLSKGGVDAP